jgi:membrane protein DedA with SNARE-associated domain
MFAAVIVALFLGFLIGFASGYSFCRNFFRAAIRKYPEFRKQYMEFIKNQSQPGELDGKC